MFGRLERQYDQEPDFDPERWAEQDIFALADQYRAEQKEEAAHERAEDTDN